MIQLSVSMSLVIALAAACGNPEAEGRAEARRRAALETKREIAMSAAKKINPPVPGRAKVPCAQLIDPAGFQAALSEPEAVTVRENTAGDFEAAAVCGIVRGGVRPDQKQQAQIIKKNAGRLGTLPGDELCSVSMYCWTIEEGPKFMERCKTQGFHEDGVMGTTACVQVIPQGADDVMVFKFFDEDTKCLIKVRGGPSMIDNELITNCAKAARDLIGPAQIAVGGAAPAPAPAPAPSPTTDPNAPAPDPAAPAPTP